MSPELPTHDELRQIDKMIDADIDDAIEVKHIHVRLTDEMSEDEILKTMESALDNDDGDLRTVIR